MGLVTRTRSTSSNREVAVTLSAKGNTLVARLIPLAREFEGDAIMGLSPEELTVLKRCLRRMYRYEKQAGCGGNRDVQRQVDLVRKGCLFLTTQSDIGFLSAAASKWTAGIRDALRS